MPPLPRNLPYPHKTPLKPIDLWSYHRREDKPTSKAVHLTNSHAIGSGYQGLHQIEYLVETYPISS